MPNYNEQLDLLNDKEREIALKILSELQTDGKSKLYDDIKYAEYKEIPVDIITFIKDNRYLGKAWHLPDGRCKLFPYWEKRLKELFPDNITTAYNNAILTGARGLGKSEIAVTCILYMMYRLMCLKNPYQTLNLKPTEQVAFVFMNITKILAEDIGMVKFQNTVKSSPWFLERGTLSKSDPPTWKPPEFINIIIGSQPSHTIGQAIYACLDYDTEIVTEDGIHKIGDLENKTIKVMSVDDSFNLCISDECTVKQTDFSDEEYQIELEDGSIIKCTPTHRFMLNSGEYKEARYLTKQDELIFFLTKLSFQVKIKKITKINLEQPKAYYDVINANPYNNFLIKTNGGTICSHNCFFDEIN